MEDFPSNSHIKKSTAKDEKPEPKKVDKVVVGEVVQRKKPLGKRFTETFVGGDVKGVAQYVMLDVLIPAAKDMVADAVSQGVERTLFGESRPSGRRGSSRPNLGRVDYHTPVNRAKQVYAGGGRDEAPARRSRANFDFGEIILASRAEADEVIDRLFSLVSQYEMATVADFYELVGVSSNHTDLKYGWVDMRGAGVTRIRSGYLLDLPRPEPLD